MRGILHTVGARCPAPFQVNTGTREAKDNRAADGGRQFAITGGKCRETNSCPVRPAYSSGGRCRRGRPGPAIAQTWPDKPITFIVPFAAGGGTDAFARPLAAQLDAQLGKRVLI